MKTLLSAIATVSFGALSLSAQAWDALPAKNEASLARGFALPTLGQSQVFAPDEQSLQTNLDVITEFYADSNPRESIVLDGETTKLGLVYRKGLGNDYEFSIEMPIYIIGGGFMDGFIQDWHRTFGLPNGGRESAPNDRRLYQYTRDGVTVLNESRSSTGIGDVQLAGGWQYNNSLALRGMVKLPTGDRDRLTGGNVGAAAWADWALPFAQDSAFDGFASGGVSVSQNKGALSSLQNSAIAFGGVGLGYHLTDRLEALSQLYLHSPLYKDTNLDGLRKAGLQLTLGGSYILSPRYKLNVYFQEDPIVSSSPDFSIHMGLSFK